MSRYTKTMREALSEVKAVEAHECEKAHPNMSHIEWVAQTKDAKNQDKDPVGKQHEHKGTEPHEHPHEPVDPDVPESGEEDWTVDEAEARTSIGTKHKIKPQYNTKTHKLITLPNGNVKVVPKSTPGMEAEETEWAKSKKQDREAQKRSEKQHDEREARYQRQKAAAKKEEVEIDELTADQKKKREASRERTHSGHKSYRQAHDAGRGQKKPDRNVRKYWEKPSSMRAGPKGKLPEDVEVDEAEMMQLKHKKSGQIMRVANKVYQKQAHIHRKRGWVPDSAQPYMKGGSAIQHSYEPEGDEHLQEAEFKVKIKGLPAFYMPGKSEATIRQELRKNVKNPKQIVSIERTTSAARKKDFRGRSQAK